MKHPSIETPSVTSLFKTPFSKKYFRCALDNLKSVRMLTVTALLCALCALVDLFFLPSAAHFCGFIFRS